MFVLVIVLYYISFPLLSFRADSALHLVEPHELSGSETDKKYLRQEEQHGVSTEDHQRLDNYTFDWTIILSNIQDLYFHFIN